MFKHITDVQFIFENDNDIIKIGTNIVVLVWALATSSTVFNAMFNDDLKEKGNVNATSMQHQNRSKSFSRSFTILKLS